MIFDLLKDGAVIAVVGMSDSLARDSYRVGKYLKNQGYRVYAVNPTIDEVDGERTYPDLASVPESIDIVNVFRRPEHAEDIVDAAVAVGAGGIWFQYGTSTPEAVHKARDAGLEVVAEACLMVADRSHS